MMTIMSAFVVLALLAAPAFGQSESFSQLSPYKGQWAFMLYKSSDKGVTFTQSTCDSKILDTPCNTPELMKDNGDLVKVTVTHASTLNTYEAGTPTEVMMRICYSSEYILERKYRKKGSPAADKSCPFNFDVYAGVDGTRAAAGAASVGVAAPYSGNTYTGIFHLDLQPELAQSVYYAQVLVKCGLSYCQYDGTDGSTAIPANYFQTDAGVYITNDMIIAAAVMSAVGPLFFIFTLVWDTIRFNKKYNK
jgi:hypothetical protein